MLHNMVDSTIRVSDDLRYQHFRGWSLYLQILRDAVSYPSTKRTSHRYSTAEQDILPRDPENLFHTLCSIMSTTTTDTITLTTSKIPLKQNSPGVPKVLRTLPMTSLRPPAMATNKINNDNETMSFPPYRYRDTYGRRTRQQRLFIANVQRALVYNDRARAQQEGDQLLITFDRDNRELGKSWKGTLIADNNKDSIEEGKVDWQSIKSIHLLDSSGLLNQRVDVSFGGSSSSAFSSASSHSPSSTSRPPHIPFHALEQDFLLQKGNLLSHHYSLPIKRPTAVKSLHGFKSWAQIALEFNLTFSGKIFVLNEDDDSGGRTEESKERQEERPWRSRQALKDEWRRLTGQPGRPVVGLEESLCKHLMTLRDSESTKGHKGRRDQGLRGLRLVLPREGGLEGRMSLIPRAVRAGYFPG